MYLKEKKVVFKAPLKPIELKITDPVSTRYRTVENFNKLKKKSWTVQNYQHKVRLTLMVISPNSIYHTYAHLITLYLLPYTL